MLIWFAGIIRGAIAFALSLTIKSSISPHKNILISTTLVVVIITTIVLGGLMSAVTKLIGLQKETVSSMRNSSVYIAGTEKPVTKPGIWRRIDDNFIKPLFGGDIKIK